MTKLFPFYLKGSNAKQLFHSYVDQHREELNRAHGSLYFVGFSTAEKMVASGEAHPGSSGHVYMFTWADVRATMLDEETVEFKVLTSLDDGDFTLKLIEKFPADRLEPIVEERKWELVRDAREREDEERERRRIEAAEKELYKKMFG